MSLPKWDHIEEIYHAALELPRSERSDFVTKACDRDIVCIEKIEALLRADASLSGFMESPIVDLGLPTLSENRQSNTSSLDNFLGSVIDERYLVERKFEAGGMSEVYFALDLKLHRRPVVMKILSRELQENSYARQKFTQETQALAHIHHPGVVDVLDHGELPNGRPYLVMKYVDGEMLRSQIPREGMDLERAASILRQIGAALEHVHKNGIFHRDLKPENILIERSTDSVVLIDFGIAKIRKSEIASSTASGVSAGTLVYMSPEQLRGELVAPASDNYSMAVIAYELVTGHRPFNPASAAHQLDLQRAGVRVKPADLRTNLSRTAQEVILRGLAFQPKARYQNAGEFGNALARALNDETREPSRLPVLSRRMLLGITLFGAILLASIAGLFVLYKYRQEGAVVGPTRSFTYWLTVQKLRDGKPYQDPFKSNGQETFESGDKFELSVSGTDPGYLYIIDEAQPETNKSGFNLIYPGVSINNGSATLGANQSVQSESISFRGPEGSENLWIVWSVSPVTELESAKTEAFKRPGGALTGDDLVAVKEFLRLKQSEIKVRVTHYRSSQTAVVRGTGDLLVTLAQFKHR